MSTAVSRKPHRMKYYRAGARLKLRRNPYFADDREVYSQFDRSEAITVLREMFVACPEIGGTDFLSLDPENGSLDSKGFYMIRLRINLDGLSKEAINAILDKHELEIMKTEDLVVIHRAHTSY